MKKRVELPLIEPLYKTYHHYSFTTAVLYENPTIRNWFLSNAINLSCNRKFLSGYTTPEIFVVNAGDLRNDLLEIIRYPMRFLGGHINFLICNLLDAGYYIHFCGVDDYYVNGKTWYKERHFSHNGMICGYDREKKEYCIYAYDKNWVYKKFWTSQKGFNRGKDAMLKKGVYGDLCAVKPKAEKIEFSTNAALKGIENYLDSDLNKYPEDGEGNVKGIVVHEYIAKYVDKLINGDIPYNKMDRRIFRLIWEHKKVMLERIERIEEHLKISNEISDKYKSVVSEADMIRVLYASHHMKRRDSILPIIKNKLLRVMQHEKELLKLLLERAKEVMENETLELS
ncbi:MAG: hypothetical protein IKV81_04225 [Clostridia bacterium]|nr:hypothetical protein [Clostridia bacterium]